MAIRSLAASGLWEKLCTIAVIVGKVAYRIGKVAYSIVIS
jgi:hypothetical protein